MSESSKRHSKIFIVDFYSEIALSSVWTAGASSFTDGDLEDGVFIAMGKGRERGSLLSLIKISGCV